MLAHSQHGRLRRGLFIVGSALVAACSAKSPNSDPIATDTQAAISIVVAPATSTPVGPVTSSSATASSASSAAAPTEIARAPECVGATFDLDALLKDTVALHATKDDRGRQRVRSGPCAYSGDLPAAAAFGGPEAIEIRVEPSPLRVAPGSTTKLTVTFVNSSKTARTVLFTRCADDPSISASALDAEGESADSVPTSFGCGVSRGCQGATAAITLAPGGTVTTTGEYRGSMRKLQPDCSTKPAGPMAVGEYQLEIRTPLAMVDPKDAKLITMRTARAPLSVKR